MLEKEPNDSFLNYAFALELEKEKKISEAISIIEKIILLDKNYLGAYYKLGKLFENVSQNEKAKQTYLLGIEIAQLQKNNKTLNELNGALQLLE